MSAISSVRILGCAMPLLLATLVAGCRSADDRVAPATARIYGPDTIGPSHGVVIVRPVPEAVYREGGIRITGGQEAYYVQRGAWTAPATLATVDDHQRIEDLRREVQRLSEGGTRQPTDAAAPADAGGTSP